MKKLVSLLLIALFGAQAATAVELKAELVVVNAQIYTMDARRPRAEALAVRGNRLAAVGSNEDIKRLVGPATRTIDAGGRLVLPGFNDAHVHLHGMGVQFFSLDLRGARSAAEMLEKIRAHTQFLPKGSWILGGGWNETGWSPAAPPTGETLDTATPDHPVFLYRAGAREALANRVALKTASLAERSPQGPDGAARSVEMNAANGIVTGEALRRVRAVTPAANTADTVAVLAAATNYAAFHGVTSVQDMSTDDLAPALAELARAGRLKTRVYDCRDLLAWRERPPAATQRDGSGALVRTGCLKSFAEGEPDETARLAAETLAADRAGLQVMIHAIGTAANANALAVFERVARTGPKRDRRFRIEHAARFGASDAARFARAGVVASLQPALFADASGAGSDPARELLKTKTALAFGSDAAIIPLDPLAGIYAAVNHRAAAQSLSVEEAVRAYTAGAAYAEFQEREKGSLATGKLADLVMLSENIFALPPAKIRDAKVLLTVTDGRVVFERK